MQLGEVQAKVQKGVNAADKTKGSYFSTNVTDRSLPSLVSRNQVQQITSPTESLSGLDTSFQKLHDKSQRDQREEKET